MMKEKIKEFKGDYNFLSNFYISMFVVNGLLYKTVEHWYQSQKMAKESDRIKIIESQSPSIAKRLGREFEMRKDWDKVKKRIMKFGVKAKFIHNKNYRKMLLDTGNKILIEGNYWHDNYWGDCYCNKCKKIKGKNNLGKILMKIRKEFLTEDQYEIHTII